MMLQIGRVAEDLNHAPYEYHPVLASKLRFFTPKTVFRMTRQGRVQVRTHAAGESVNVRQFSRRVTHHGARGELLHQENCWSK